MMLNLKPTHKLIQEYYSSIKELSEKGHQHEGAVAPAFANLLQHCASLTPHLNFVQQFPFKGDNKKPLRADGVLVDRSTNVLIYGIWEAKDLKDHLEKEIRQKFQQGYPKDNILFQTPKQLVLYQQGELVFDKEIHDDPKQLTSGLETFFAYQPPEYAQWEEAITAFKERVAELGQALVDLIEQERKKNKTFIEAFNHFHHLCRQSLNPNLADAAVIEMLAQHLLTERLFRKVFANSDFVKKNAIAQEIEKVITALLSKSFSREMFLKGLDRFYVAIERTAETISDYHRKQKFMTTVYEKFFQGFAVKVADTHGIVYTPPPLVEFMVNSVEEILQREFKRSLSSPDVHILDPFVGTGSFMVEILQRLEAKSLLHKYQQELHCNEVLLLPYYIASANIEHAFYERTKHYEPFEGICLVDTFGLLEPQQADLFGEKNTTRVKQQKESEIFVIIGNPPYNVGQVNENDNNKNRKYGEIERLIKETYAKDSKATLKNALSDPYVKAFKWATQRLKERKEGIIALVTNNSFLDGIAFDGMRQHLGKDFNAVYVLDLGGNIRKKPGVQNVFDIKVGVSIALLIKGLTTKKGIFYSHIGDHLKKQEKLDYLSKKSCNDIGWQQIKPDKSYTWLTEGLQDKFETFIPLGTKEDKAVKRESEGVLFKIYSNGVKTNRDAWAYNFNREELATNMQRTVEFYNQEVFRWSRQSKNKQADVDNFVSYDDTRLSWSSTLKQHLKYGDLTDFAEAKLRTSLYRPYTKQFVYFDNIFVDRRGQFPKIFPSPETEQENQVICVGGYGRKHFAVLVSNYIPDLNFYGDPQQTFPFYTYDEDGTNRRENLTDWALQHFCTHYKNRSLTKWDIFHYVYALLHHPDYRETYAANLKRELPRIPLLGKLAIFQTLVQAGQDLAHLHLHYEEQDEYPLTEVIQDPLDWRVEKMRLNSEKTALIYNDSLTLQGIPAEVYQYRLGNRSVLEWVVDRYAVTTDARSGIVNDPNRLDDEQYIVRLIKQVVTVSVKTVEIVKQIKKVKGLEKG